MLEKIHDDGIGGETPQRTMYCTLANVLATILTDANTVVLKWTQTQSADYGDRSHVAHPEDLKHVSVSESSCSNPVNT